MTYADLVIRILERQDKGYPVEITVDGRQEFQRGYLDADFLPWVASVKAHVDGERLFNWFFADELLRNAWYEIRGRYPDRRIRLRIDASAPELHTIPWESLRDPGNESVPQDLAAAVATPFSRYLANKWSPGAPLQRRPIKILVAIANPHNLADYGLTSLDVDIEWSIIEKATTGLDVRLTRLSEPCTLSTLETELKKGYQILHFVGHGKYSKRAEEAAVYLADQDNYTAPVNNSAFVSMLARQLSETMFAEEHGLRLVFLASCQTATTSPANVFRGIAHGLIAAGVPAVLAMQDQVPVHTTREFTRTFYRQLLHHGQVDLAANEARSALLTGNFPGSSIPALFSRLPRNELLHSGVDGIASAIKTKPFEPETVYIPPGQFLMGSRPDETRFTAETPQHEVDLPAYRIGKYPVTNAQYAEFIHQTGRLMPPEAGWIGQSPPADKLDHPIAGITWYDALAYCKWLSEQTGRNYALPSEAQWEKAARGEDGRVYPWGNDWDPARCSYGHSQTTPVDAYPEGVSPYGCYDMAGNVGEWTSSLWGEKLPAPNPEFRYPWTNDQRENLQAGRYVLRVCRGGSATNKPEQLRCSARSSYFPDKGSARTRYGFRVVLNPDSSEQNR
ncbi:MAG: SUMF1/EgtB/PvdO family nonheme iron enzyme [Anaerolineae bacterium]|nr:SUMF1/EgtB/PvdO family nonheme iron enzyme [Anaerolineae bacterium]